MTGICEGIVEFNSKRDPKKVQLKYAAMRESSFRFLRGTVSLFYSRLTELAMLPASPNAWLCGDLHLENFGSFRGYDKEVYFDINDFDEAILGPALWELCRLLTSIAVACADEGYDDGYTKPLLNELIKGYALTLKAGKPVTVEHGTATGIIKTLLTNVAGRKEKELVRAKTDVLSGYNLLLIDDKHLFRTGAEEKKQWQKKIQSWMDETRGAGNRKVIDLAYMVAGTGSIGLKRFLLLAEDTRRNKKYLLVIKEALPSSLQPFLATNQPAWKNEAERICSVQQRMQHVSPGALGTVFFEGDWYVSKWVQPVADKINLRYFIKEKKQQLSLVYTLGQLTGSAQLRSGGRDGSAITDEMINFGNDTGWQTSLLNTVNAMTRLVQEDFKSYCDCYDKGYFKKRKK